MIEVICSERPPVFLNSQEETFLKLVCQDLTYREIAALMYRGERTIDNYRDALMKKLNVKSRTGLVVWAIKMQLVTIDDL